MDTKDLKGFAEAQILVCRESLEKIAEFPEEERERLAEFFTNNIAVCELAIRQMDAEVGND